MILNREERFKSREGCVLSVDAGVCAKHLRQVARGNACKGWDSQDTANTSYTQGFTTKSGRVSSLSFLLPCHHRSTLHTHTQPDLAQGKITPSAKRGKSPYLKHM